MTVSSTFRELSLEPGSPLDNKIPSGLHVTAARKGGPITLRYRVEFLDADDQVVVGGTEESPDAGSMTLQWWAVVFADAELKTASAAYPWPLLPQPPVKTTELGETVGVTAGVNTDIAVRGPYWVWPQVVAVTAPEVFGQVTRVSIPEVTPDGTYSIQRDDEDPVEVDAVGMSWNQILGELADGFDGDTVVTVAANYDDQTLMFSSAAGETFELTLVSPGDILTQETLPLGGSTGSAVKARLIAQVVGPLVEIGGD